MPIEHESIFAALGAPFEPHEVKERTQAGRTFSYITARTVMNRLDNVVGPMGWEDRYEPFGPHGGVKCRLTLTMPDGSMCCKEGVGGSMDMQDPSDTDKTGESDALKRAAVKFGIARYLYRDGVPSFVPDPDGGPRARPAQGSRTPQEASRASTWGNGQTQRQDAPAGRQGGQGEPGKAYGAPRSGKGLFAWVKQQEEEHHIALLKYMNAFGKLQEFPGRMVDWDAEQVALGHKEALRKLSSVVEAQPAEEALSNGAPEADDRGDEDDPEIPF